MVTTFDSLIQAIGHLRKLGFTDEFKGEEQGVKLLSNNKFYDELDLTLHYYFKFEDDSSADETTELFAITTEDGHKGVLIDSPGTYSTLNFLRSVKRI